MKKLNIPKNWTDKPVKRFRIPEFVVEAEMEKGECLECRLLFYNGVHCYCTVTGEDNPDGSNCPMEEE